MFDVEQMDRAERRYEERTPEREKTGAMIAAGAILEANPTERVRARLERKGLAPETVEAVIRGEEPDVAVGTTVGGRVGAPRPTGARRGAASTTTTFLERIIGNDDLIEAGFLATGARAARSVCRVEIGSGPGRSPGYGTGVMVSPGLLLTNNHVLETAEVAARSRAGVDHETSADGALRPPVLFQLDPDAFFVTSVELDFTLVGVRPGSPGGQSLPAFGWTPLIEAEGKALLGEFVNIVQHPNGGPKQVALRQNQIVDIADLVIHYSADTDPGSSGAPVFNDEWELVALHHSGVPRKNARGQILLTTGEPWKKGTSEDRIDWVANEGIRVSRIVKHLRGQRLSAARRRLLDEALDPQRPPNTPLEDPLEGSPRDTGGASTVGLRHPDAGLQRRDESRPEPSTDAATMTWTIPLRVSVQVGTPTMDDAGLSALAAGIPPPDAGGRRSLDFSATIAAGSSSNNGVPRPAGHSASVGTAGTDGGGLAEALALLEVGRARPPYDAEADERDRDAYYRPLPKERTSKGAFFGALSRLVTATHQNQLTYDPPRYLYPWVDLWPDGMLRSIYTGDTYDPEEFIRQDVQAEVERAVGIAERLGVESAGGGPRLAEALDLLEALHPYNCEHVVPQSWYEKREPMRGDLHHLFACESRCNSFRGNTPYFDFTDVDEAIREDCGKRVDTRFEPVHGKGQVARATLYFLLRHQGDINRVAREYEEDRIETLLAWHKAEPVSDHERHRNAAIFEKQGNRNPLIDHPDWATRVDFTAGLGPVVPTP